MLVYGDASRRERVADKLARIGESLDSALDGAGIERHGRLVAALIEAGELVQGLADERLGRTGREGRDPGVDEAMGCATAIARLVVGSWDSGFALVPDPGAARSALALLDPSRLAAEIVVRAPEGIVHYAVYPEGYAEAARSSGLGPSATVIGIRSIGATLAAIVAAALGAAPPATVRPTGHPFARELSVGRELGAEWAGAAGAAFAVVDEGPGLSGSSVAAVAEALARAGAAPGRIHLFTSHGHPPGPEASEPVRAIWARSPRHVRTFDDLVLGGAAPEHRLESWVADLVGPAVAPLQDVSGGAWRFVGPAAGSEVPVHAWQERRKFICDTSEGRWLLKFAGLGRYGLRRFDRARALGEAGFTPEPAGWRHGFLVERWHEGTRLERGAGRDPAFRAALARYLGFRARHFPADPECGASAERLSEMAAYNAGQALGPDAARALERLAPALAAATRSAVPVETDNRLHAWEWLQVGERFLKTDAVDHHQGHDLVGCQDIAWDVAGAGVEFDLDPAQVEQLGAAVAAESGRAVSAGLVGLLGPVYLAFQLGSCALAERTAAPAERPHLGSALARYRSRLGGELGAEPYASAPSTRM